MARLIFLVATIFIFFDLCASSQIINLDTPLSTYKSCNFENLETVPSGDVDAVISNCFTRTGKVALLGYVYLGIAWLETWESMGEGFQSNLASINSKHGIFSKTQDLEESISLITDTELNLYLIDLVRALNAYNSEGFSGERYLENLVYSNDVAFGYVITPKSAEREESKYKLYFVKTPKGWLIDDIGNSE